MTPTTCADWRRCIERDGGIPRTAEFVAARLADLRDPHSHPTMWLAQAATAFSPP
jgi:hypothetical protein